MIRPVRRAVAPGSVRRLFTVYAVMSLVPILVLGAVLLRLLDSQDTAQGMAEGRGKAQLIASTSIAPQLDGADLRAGLSQQEIAALSRSAAAADGTQILRLRVRDLEGNVVFPAGSGGPDDESLQAARGISVVHLTYLNADADADAGSDSDGPERDRGPRAIEVYQPLLSAQDNSQIGVLELYLPYAPIAHDIARGRRLITVVLGCGLFLLWLCLLAVSTSVTRRLRRQAVENGFLASHDSLTGMPNRAQFSDRADHAIAEASADRPTAIALIDLDRFKEVNDTLGHDNGDKLLVALAERLKLDVRDGDTIARLGGDEFGVVLSRLHGAGEAVEVLSRLRAALAEPLQIDGLPLAIEASVGFALAPTDATDSGTLLQQADVAMYAAKNQRLGVAHYRTDYDQFDASTLSLIAELGNAIAHDQLVLHYQPKADLEGGTVTAVEALVRWQHPTRGLLYPDAFLPAAEQTELIEQLTRWVLRKAVLMLAELDTETSLSIAVNISARSLGRADFAQEVLDILRETGTDPRRVMLEITETSLMADPAGAARTLRQLHDAGVRLSIDDFGAGQTSLGYLATLPIAELKIDKAFVLAMHGDERNAAIVRSVIELGHSLGFTVTAEGVETLEALRQLSAYRCDTVQGYLLSRPVGSADLAGRIDAAHVVLDANRATTSALAQQLTCRPSHGNKVADAL